MYHRYVLLDPGVHTDPSDRVLGYATLGPARGPAEPGFAGEIYELYVRPGAQRRGIARPCWPRRATSWGSASRGSWWRCCATTGQRGRSTRRWGCRPRAARSPGRLSAGGVGRASVQPAALGGCGLVRYEAPAVELTW